MTMQTIIEDDQQQHSGSPVASLQAYTTVGTPSSQRDRSSSNHNTCRTPESPMPMPIYGGDRVSTNPPASSSANNSPYQNGGSQSNKSASLPFNGGIIPFLDPATLNQGSGSEGRWSPRHSTGADSIRPHSDSLTSSNPRYSNGPAQYSDRAAHNARVPGEHDAREDEFMYNDIPVYANSSSPEHRYNSSFK
jgi:hypothetical protein